MDPVTIAMIVSMAILLIERVFAWANKIKKSNCLGVNIEMKEEAAVIVKPPTA